MTEELGAIAWRLVVGRKRDGRCAYDAKAKEDLVRIAREPGLSLARIARTCGINANVLTNWMQLHERGAARAAAGDVIEMQPSAFVAVQLELPARATTTTSSTLDVQGRLPNGIAQDPRGCDADGAARLAEAAWSTASTAVRTLRHPPCGTARLICCRPSATSPPCRSCCATPGHRLPSLQRISAAGQGVRTVPPDVSARLGPRRIRRARSQARLA